MFDNEQIRRDIARMKTIELQEPINLKVVRFELDFTPTYEEPKPVKKPKIIRVPCIKLSKKPTVVPQPPQIRTPSLQKRDVKDLVEELLDEIYADQRDWASSSIYCSQKSTPPASVTSSQSNYGEHTDAIERSYLDQLDMAELRAQTDEWEERLRAAGERLARSVRTRDRLRRQQKRLCAALTVLLRHIRKL